jgi:Tfp pilus assembly PilM family ATPase
VSVQDWLTPVPPSVAIEVAARRITVVEVEVGVGGGGVTAYAGEGLPDGAVSPMPAGSNIPEADMVRAAIRRALERAGLTATRRAALIVPDSVARVSLLSFDQIPARAQDLDQLVRWQLRKSAPFPVEDAVIAHFPAGAADGRTSVAAVMARRDVLAQYEALAAGLGIHAGIVDLASFNVMNTILTAAPADGRDWLVVHVATESTTLAVLRGSALMFYRNRAIADDETLGSLVHQTAMYHEDRLGGGGFARVWLSGAGTRRDEIRHQIASRLEAPVEVVDVRPAAAVDGLDAPSVDVLDALAAPVGVLVRERRQGQE